MDLPSVTGTNNGNRQVSVDAWNDAVDAINDSGKKSEANTWTENQTFGAADAAVTRTVTIRSAVGYGRTITFSTGALARIAIGLAATTEPGSDANGDLQFFRYSDAGVYLGSGFTFKRSSGRITTAVTTTTGGTGTGYAHQSNNRNDGTAAGTARRHDLISTSAATDGFDINQSIISSYTGLNAGYGLSSWIVTASPTDITKAWGTYCQEMNPINRGGDFGYSRIRSVARWVGGSQVTPESEDRTGEVGNATHHVLFGFCLTPSNGLTATGDHAKSYNGYMIEQDAIAPGGVGFLASGDTSAEPAKLPNYVMNVDGRWKRGIRTVEATFTDDRAIALKQSHRIAWMEADGTTLRREITDQSVVLSAPVPVLRYLLPEQVGGLAGAGAAGGADSLRFFMGYLRRDITVDALGLRITTAVAGGNMQIGIWAADSTTAFPTGAPLVTSASLSTASAAAVTDTAATGSLKAGWYWFATNADTTAATAVALCFNTTSTQMLSQVGQGTISTGVVVGLAKSQTFGTWPTLTGNATTDGLSVISNASVPAVFYMAA